MSMSTPLDVIYSPDQSTAPPADEERVKRILAEMHGATDATAASAAAGAPPPPPATTALPRVISEPPIQTSTGQIRMDIPTARANVIGGSTPTMADFQAMFSQTAPGMAPYHGPMVAPGPVIPPVSKQPTWKAQILSQLRGPLAVAILVFFLNMPVVTAILSRYASWMYLSSGEISVGGLLVKALLAGILFAGYQAAASVMDK
jgi:hypothetical protein